MNQKLISYIWNITEIFHKLPMFSKIVAICSFDICRVSSVSSFIATSVTFYIFHFVKWILPEFSYCAMVKTAVAVHSGGCTPLNCFPPPTSRCNILIIGTFSSACTDFNPTPTLPWSSNNLTNQQQHWTNLRDTFRGNYPCQI